MKDEHIEICLKDLEDSEFGMRVFKHKPDVVGNELTVYLQEYRNLRYLENDLKLIHILEERPNIGGIYFLTSKGKEILKKGNWIKYCGLIEKEKRNKKQRDIVAFWFSIALPILSIFVAYLALKNDNKSMKEEVLKELHNTNQIDIKKEVKSYMEKLNPKKTDSVSLMTEK
jgi:hypothetical protein